MFSLSGGGAPPASPRPRVEHVGEIEIQKAIDELQEMKRKGLRFGNAHMRMVGRHVAAAEGATRLHRAVAYHVDVIFSHGPTSHRLLYRLENCGGKPVFLRSSSHGGRSIHDDVFAQEAAMFPDAPYTWMMFKNVLKAKGATDLEPAAFLAAALRAAAQDAGRGDARGEDELIARLWAGELRLKEPRQIIDKVKYVKDWGDLSEAVRVRLSLSSNALEARIERARGELLAASPRASRSCDSLGPPSSDGGRSPSPSAGLQRAGSGPSPLPRPVSTGSAPAFSVSGP